MNPVMIIFTPASQMARLSGAGCEETRTSSSNREVRGLITPIDPTLSSLGDQPVDAPLLFVEVE